MKKILLTGVVLSLIGFSSCLKDGKNEVTQSFTTSSLNIITSESTGEIVVAPGFYTYDLVVTDLTGNIASSKVIFNNASLDFTSDDQTYKTNGSEIYFENAHSPSTTNSSVAMKNGNFVSLSYTKNPEGYGYFVNENFAGDYTYTIDNFSTAAVLRTVAKYYIGNDLRVNTFQTNTFFLGTTTTSYPSADGIQNYTTEGITYRFQLNLEDSSATMLMYNAKFSASEREPVKAVIIAEGLDLDFTPEGVKITGQNIVPGVVEGNQITPMESFTFNNIEFETTNDLYTEGTLDFTVAGIYQGHFEGSYINSYYMK